MDRTAGHFRADGGLHPVTPAFDSRQIDVGDGHSLYVEQSGNRHGQPVVVLHGGPGGGCSPFMRRFFDPEHYRIVMFDQRGCGRSLPTASVTANTTAHLVADIERLRQGLGLDDWIVFGGSWGATLALTYAQTHPERIKALVLRGVFLGMRHELDWFYGGGAARYWPERWQEFCAPIPPEERDDMIAAYHRRLFSGDRPTEERFGQIWMGWENALAALEPARLGPGPAGYARTFARLECHYFFNDCFLEQGQLLRDRHRIEHVPAVIVQGRYDMVCPPESAWRLAQGWERADLRMVGASGHALSETRIATELVRAMDEIRDRGV